MTARRNVLGIFASRMFCVAVLFFATYLTDAILANSTAAASQSPAPSRFLLPDPTALPNPDIAGQ